MFKLAERQAGNCGVYCGEEGLYLGPAALIERHGGLYRVRPATEIEALLAAAFNDPPDLAGCLSRLRRVVAHLQYGDHTLAQIAALHLALPEISGERIERLAQTDRLLKANFNPDEPRIPAGSGRESGEWTDGDASPQGAGSGSSSPPTTQPRSGSGDDAVRRPAASNPHVWEDFPNADFRNRLAIAELTADRPDFGYGEVHDTIDSHGVRHIALGRYQMRPVGLLAAGMIDARGNWTGKYGIHSQAEFLADPEAQERALSDYLADNERQLRAYGVFTHLGRTIDGLKSRFTITRAGLVAAAHRHGPRAIRDYLRKIGRHQYRSKGLGLSKEERAIETRLRTFAEASYE